MNHLANKFAILISCCLLFVVYINVLDSAEFATMQAQPATYVVISLLVAITATCLTVINNSWLKFLTALALTIATLFLFPLKFSIALCVYIYLECKENWQKLVGISLCLASLYDLNSTEIIFNIALMILASLLYYNTNCYIKATLKISNNRDLFEETKLRYEKEALHLEQLREMQAHRATLEERARIARDIHDNVGHLLTRSIYQVDALEVIHQDDVTYVEELKNVGRTLHEAMDDMRKSIHALHAEARDLPKEIQDIVNNYPRISVSTECLIDQMPENIADTMLILVKECFQNVIKHSNATHVSISIVENPGFWRFRFKDNGGCNDVKKKANFSINGGYTTIGSQNLERQSKEFSLSNNPRASTSFEPGKDTERENDGLGLRSMRERIESQGGTFKTFADDGFTVFATIPKRAEQN